MSLASVMASSRKLQAEALITEVDDAVLAGAGLEDGGAASGTSSMRTSSAAGMTTDFELEEVVVGHGATLFESALQAPSSGLALAKASPATRRSLLPSRRTGFKPGLGVAGLDGSSSALAGSVG